MNFPGIPGMPGGAIGGAMGGGQAPPGMSQQEMQQVAMVCAIACIPNECDEVCMKLSVLISTWLR